MTISTTTSAAVYTGTGTTATYPYTWQIVQDADLIVWQLAADGVTLSHLALDTDYTVTGAGFPTGGNVVLSAGHLASGARVFFGSDPEQIQALLLQQGSAFNPADVMAALDLLTREVQATRRIANNGIQIPLVESLDGLTTTLPAASARALRPLMFDSLGNVIAGTSSVTGTISSVMQPTVAASTLAVARSLMGVAAQTVLNVKEAPYYAIGDGSTDDTASIQAALTAAGTGGQSVFIPNGSYKITSQLTVPDTVRVMGEGKYTTILLGAIGANSVLKAAGTINVDGANKVSISDLTIKATATGGNAIALLWGGLNVIERVSITWDSTHKFVNGIILEQQAGVKIIDCDLAAVSGKLIWVPFPGEFTTYGTPASNYVTFLTIDHCQLNLTNASGTASACAVVIDNGEGVLITNCNFNGALSGQKAIVGSKLLGYSIIGNYIEQASVVADSSGIELNTLSFGGSASGTCKGGAIHGNFFAWDVKGVNSGGVGAAQILVNAHDTGLSIVGNYIESNHGFAIRISGTVAGGHIGPNDYTGEAAGEASGVLTYVQIDQGVTANISLEKITSVTHAPNLKRFGWGGNTQRYLSTAPLLTTGPETFEIGDIVWSTAALTPYYCTAKGTVCSGGVGANNARSTLGSNTLKIADGGSTGNLAVGQYITFTGTAGSRKVLRIFDDGVDYQILFDGAGADATTNPVTIAYQAPTFRAGQTEVVLTANLPAAGSANDGRMIIEDAGAGDRNLIIYGGGQRFRIDGGAPV